jgi:CBS domain-containing protein
MKAKDLMASNVRTVRANQTLADAARVLWDCDCGAVPVLDEAGERIVGMLTDRDICMAAWSRNQLLSDIPVSSVHSRDVFTCVEDADIDDVEQLMRRKQVRRVPVVDSAQRIVGIVSLADIAKNVGTQPRSAASMLSASDVAATLANICRREASARELRSDGA